MNRIGTYYYLATGFSVLVALLVGMLILFEADRSIDAVYIAGERQGEFLFSTVSQQISDSLYFNDVEQLREDAEVLGAQNQVGRIAIFNAEGLFLFDSAQSMVPEGNFDPTVFDLARQNTHSLYRRVGESIEFVGAMRFDGSLIGGIYFELDLSEQLAAGRASLLTTTLVSALVVLLLAGLSFALAQFFGTRQSLQRIEDNFRALINQSPLPYGVFHRSGDISFANPAMRDLIGGIQSPIPGRRGYNIFKDPGIQRAGVTELFRKGFSEGPVDIPRYRYIVDVPGGEEQSFYFKGVVFPINSTDKSMGEVAFMFEDVTSEVVAEQQQQDLNRMLLQSQKLEGLGVMARGIAHDFNNLLTPVMASADLLSRKLGEDDQHKGFLENIIRGARKAADLCTQLLAYGRDEAGRKEITDLSAEVRDIQRLIRSSVSKNVAFSENLDVNLPVVHVDKSQIRQVILNLLINASEAIEDSRGEVELSTGETILSSEETQALLPDPTLPSGRYVYLQIRDNGVGMDETTLRNLFDPFFSTKFTGRGLGMSVVLGIIGDNEGGIRVESEPGEGTTVSVYFRSQDDFRENDETVVENALQEFSGTVLLADDEPGVLATNKQLLELMGFKVITAVNGADAVQKYEEHEDGICCAVLDLMMPVLDGEGAVSELRKSDPALPVVIVTGLKEEDTIFRLRELQNLEIVSKPYLMADLQEAVNLVLS